MNDDDVLAAIEVVRASGVPARTDRIAERLGADEAEVEAMLRRLEAARKVMSVQVGAGNGEAGSMQLEWQVWYEARP